MARFRLHPYAATTDIEKAFLNIRLHDDDKDVTRFFWLSDPKDPNSPLITYRFRVVLFGTTCSPFMLNATLMKHLQLDQSNTSQILKRDLYVDHVLSSFPDQQSLLTFYNESRPLLSSAGLRSNDIELQRLAASDQCMDKDETLKILGLKWDVQADKIMFQNNLSYDEKSVCTKREILKQSSSVYDPLGILSPITVKTKILIQSIWEQKFEWDQPLPEDINLCWIEMDDLRKVLNIEIPRCLFGKRSTHRNFQERSYSLHIFTDASQSAYGTCAYLVSDDESPLVMARNRVDH